MRVFAYGRLRAVPSRTWERVLRQHGSERCKRSRGADLIVIGAGASIRTTAQVTDDVAGFRQGGQEVVSERGFLRRIGFLPGSRDAARDFSATTLATRSKLSDETIDLLALFDVVEPDAAGKYGFRDLKAAVLAGQLLQKVTLADLVHACGRMRELLGVSAPLSELNVQVDSEGRIVLSTGDKFAELSGQVRLDLDHSVPTVATLVAKAEDAREGGDNRLAIAHLRKALSAAPKDLDALFDLGSLLCELEEFAEGIALLRRATVLRPGFADAFYNIGHAYERQGRRHEARSAYGSAVLADPSFADPLYNLGMIELDQNDFSEAIRHFDAYLAIDPQSEWAAKARKALSLARMSAVKAAAS